MKTKGPGPDRPFRDLLLDTHAWREWAPREGHAPVFHAAVDGGPGGRTALTIASGGDDLACGCWRTSLMGLEADRHYRLEAVFRTEGVAAPQKSVRAILTSGTVDEAGTFYDHLGPAGERDGWHVLARDLSGADAPPGLVLSLFFAYAPSGRVLWGDARCYDVEPATPRNVRVAVVSGNPKGGQSPAELADFYCGRLDALAGRERPDIVCLPELINVTGLPDRGEFAEPIPGPTSLRLAEKAREHGFWVAASLLEEQRGGFRNTGVLIDRHGGFVGKYRKTHPTIAESLLQGTAPGNDYPVFHTDFGMVGYMICYDGHYPEVPRILSLEGAEIILFSNAGDGREGGDMWEPTVRTRAVDNQVHIAAAVNNGKSLIVNPRGVILDRADGTPGGTAQAVCELGLSVRDYTQRPIHRRYDLLRRSDTYGPLLRSVFER